MEIIDKIFMLPGIREFRPFYDKYNEVVNYLVFGALAFVVSVLTYVFFSELLKLNVLVANVFSWIITVYFAFFTNRKYVFHSDENYLRQILGFYQGRLLTLAIEEAILYVFIKKLAFNNVGVKICAQIIIIILNYVISKFLVFTKKENVGH